MAHQMPVGQSMHRVLGLSTIISPGFMGHLGTGWEAEPAGQRLSPEGSRAKQDWHQVV